MTRQQLEDFAGKMTEEETNQLLEILLWLSNDPMPIIVRWAEDSENVDELKAQWE